MHGKTVIKNKGKTIIITFVAIALFALSFVFISSSLNIKTVKDKEILNYNSNSKANYQVNLKENNYFTEKVLPEGEQYITSVIDNVEIDYNYNLSTSKKINGTYNYRIIANVNADHKLDSSISKKVWSKDYVVKESNSFLIENESSISISDKVNITYDEYNEIINNFKKDYMLAVESKVDVYMQVFINGKYEDKEFNENSKIVVSIPLSEQTIDIKKDYKENNFGNLTKKVIVKRFNNIYIFTFGVILALIGLAILLKQLINIIKEDKKQSKYIKILNKYLHDYSDIIATVKSKPNTSNLKLIEFVNFEELVNAQNDLRVPIVFCETKKNYEGYFYLITQDCAYFYVLKEEK